MYVGGNFVAHKLSGYALDRWDSMPPPFVIDVILSLSLNKT